MTPEERWLAAVWPFVRHNLPAPPAAVTEIGCGPLGGFVARMRSAGYQAAGVDPEAPDGPWYRRAEFESYDHPEPVQAVVACTSLHHVADVGAVLDLTAAALVPGGTVIVVEWARERFDEAAARWCFDRLRPAADHPSWLQRRQEEWLASGLPWRDYCEAWAQEEGLHAGEDIVRELDDRFDRQSRTYGPYFFPDLAGITEDDEQAAIDGGAIQASRISYTGLRP
jgi:SAM-dependent methyltransferase